MRKIISSKRCFSNEYKYLNRDVNLTHLHIKEGESEKKPMIVLHGLLGSKMNWRGICKQEPISSLRDCYLVEMRNHANSNHHAEMDYDVLSDDIIRFADQ